MNANQIIDVSGAPSLLRLVLVSFFCNIMADTRIELTAEEQVFSFLVDYLFTLGGVGLIAAGTVQTGSINTEEVYTLRVARSQRLIKTKKLEVIHQTRDPIIVAPNGGGICLSGRQSDNVIVDGDVLTVVSKP